MADRALDDEVEELTEDIARRWAPERLGRMVASRAGGGEALPWHLRQRFESDLGVDLAHVRVFRGEFAQHVAKERGADALTVGDTGMVLLGQQAASAGGSVFAQRVLAHEVAHVAQGAKGLFARGPVSAPADQQTLEVEAHRYEAQFVDDKAPSPPSQLREQVRRRVRDMVQAWLASEHDRRGLGEG
ncbi:MAG: DUF4157 domain-containing protein [Myxococcales bacterium]|nr:DUF4157 domain-containing protein [Myxococcales bacterium]